MSHVFPLGSPSSVQFLAGHVTGQFRLLILMTPCWMGASWLPTVLNMLVDITYYCPIVTNVVMDYSVDWLLKGLPLLHLTLWLCRDVYCADGFSSSVFQAGTRATHTSMANITSNGRRNGPVGVLQRVYQIKSFLPLNLLISWFTCLRLDWLGK